MCRDASRIRVVGVKKAERRGLAALSRTPGHRQIKRGEAGGESGKLVDCLS